MKVLAVVTYYHPHWTGLTSHAVRVAEDLVARGHDVTVLTTRHTPTLPPRERRNGVEIVRLRPIARFSRGMITPTFPFVAAARIRRSDVVQIHTPLPEALLVATLCRARGRPLVMTHHGDVVMPPGHWNRAIETIAYRLLEAAASRADAVTSYSRDYAEHSPVLSPSLDRVVPISPPVDIPEPIPRQSAAWRSALGVADKPLVGIAGRWVREKGFDSLLDAMPRVREALPGAHLVFAGETNVVYEDTYSDDQARIEAQREHVSFVGLVRDPQKMADFYGMCDVLVLPSRTDMFATVQVEAMLCGTPVVATDIPGARVVVSETGCGRLVPPGDPEALAAGVIEVLRDPDRFRPVRQAIRRTFDARASLDAFEQVLESVRRKPRRRMPTDPIPGFRPGRSSSSLTEKDHAALDQMLRNEADMAYRRRARFLLDSLELRDGDRVLDCGCGFGVHLMLMSRLRDLDLVGVDAARDRLTHARRERIPAALANTDLNLLPFRDECFDRVLMSEVLEHLEDDRRALAEVHRVLKPGGILALSVPHARYPFLWDPVNSVWTALGGKPIRSGPLAGIWSGHEVLYQPKELVAAVRSAGFVPEIVEEATHYAFPFSHLLVYGIGKPLFERNLLPSSMHHAADRFRGEESTGSLLNPVHLGVATFRLVDRLNERPAAASKRTFVNVLVKARKPDRA
jgi:glycosyltransferase involved in cell wall biosynthesis/2-polyprenyl-3-methyl-5-hydroxy-6-metoxy-1,4-benzoquinol methylase